MRCRFGGLWYTKPDDAIECAKFRSRLHDAVIRLCDDAWNAVPDARAIGRF